MKPELLFYDGGCGLCHRSVTFILRRDRDGSLFRFAPLGGSTFEGAVPREDRQGLPDSLVLQAADGTILVRSAAILHIGERLGGEWRLLARVAGWLPRTVLDWNYDLIARIRYRLFARPHDVCPVVSAELRARFLP
jgi:predicted DCC family thiol-disulfide oxidoreductase YuxK